jgi:hypothetical protein
MILFVMPEVVRASGFNMTKMDSIRPAGFAGMTSDVISPGELYTFQVNLPVMPPLCSYARP